MPDRLSERGHHPGRAKPGLGLPSTGKSRAAALAAALALSLASAGMLISAGGRLGIAGDAVAYSALGLAIYLALVALAPRRRRQGRRQTPSRG